MDIAQYNRQLAATRVCENCPMAGKGTFVGADSSSGLVEQREVLFLGLNPGTEEARIGLPFVGPSGQFLRSQLQKANIPSWAMANSLLCSSPNESAIIKADAAREACHRNLAGIYLAFRPQLIVPCGNGAWSLFKVGMAITAATENCFISTGPSGKSKPVLVLPIFHPSALIRSGGENSAKYPQFLERLQYIGKLAEYTAANGVHAVADYVAASGRIVHKCFSAKAGRQGNF